MGSPDFHVGQKVEYFSPSFGEWIECKIAIVRPDGTLKLEHGDGTGTLKEAADPSRVRPVGSPTGPKASPPPPLPGGAVNRGRAGGLGGAVPKAGGGPRKAPSSASLPSGGDATPKVSARRPSSGGMLAGPEPSVGKAGGPAPRSAPVRSQSRGPATPRRQESAGPGSQKELSSTLNPKPMYVGDRVKLKSSGRSGEVMYIGPAQFAGGDTVIGIKLDEKRSTSDCDGKYKNERYFRCTAGYGIYQSREEVELMPPEQADEDIRSLNVSPAPDAVSFDLDGELDKLVGLSEVKDSLKHARNFIEVQRRRMSVVGDNTARALHFAFLHGGAGNGISTVARLLGGLLLKLGVLSSGHVVEVTRKDLLAGCGGGDVDARIKKVVRAAEGGVLLVADADALKDSERSDRLGEEAVVALGKQLESTKGATEWPQRFCIACAGKRGELQKFLTEQPSIATAIFAKFEFSDLSALDTARILRRLVEENKFQLAKELTDERLEVLVRRRTARGGGGGDGAVKNVRLAKMMLEEAVSRQTDRVWAKETLSYTGLTALVEEDFIDKAKDQSEAAEAALRKLDAVVGLKPVKEMIRSLYAELLLDQQKRDMGIEGRGAGSTLHMIFEGNPGTGKTTIARVVADLLKALGLLRTGHLVEADRSSLVAGYSGQTALKTKAVVESALGGVLFVDEAYALVGEDGKDSFGKEALDTLIKLVEDYRTDLVVILAGYSAEMSKLLDTNPGLRSRFPNVMTFTDYSTDELLEIADQMLLQDVLMMSHAAGQRLRQVLTDLTSAQQHSDDKRASGNGRAVRNILERAKRNQALRLQHAGSNLSKDELCTLLPGDFDGCN